MIDTKKKQKILSVITNSSDNKGIYLEEIIKITGFSRYIVGKYVPVLVAEKSVKVDIRGNNKFIYLNKSPVEIKGGG